MADVTVKATHAVMDLADGEIATIECTDLVDNLIEQERLIVVPDAVVPDGGAEGGLLPNDPDVSLDHKDQLQVPGRGASRDVWAAFLTLVELPAPEGAGRDELRDYWDAHKDDVDLTVVRPADGDTSTSQD